MTIQWHVYARIWAIEIGRESRAHTKIRLARIYKFFIFFLLLRVYRPLKSYRHTHSILQFSLSFASAFQSFSDFTSFLIASFHLKRDLPSVLFLSGLFSINTCKTGFWICHACPAHCNLQLLYASVIFCFWKSLQLVIFPCSPVPSLIVLHRTNFLFKYFSFNYTINLFSSVFLKGHASAPS